MTPNQIALAVVALLELALVLFWLPRVLRVAQVEAELVKVRDELRRALIKASGPELLDLWAPQAIAYAETKGGTAREKLSHAGAYMEVLDRGDNGVRNFTSAQYRGAIEKALKA